MNNIEALLKNALSGGNKALISLIRSQAIDLSKITFGRAGRGVMTGQGVFWVEGHAINQKELAGALSLISFFKISGEKGDWMLTNDTLGVRYRLYVKDNRVCVLMYEAKYETDILSGQSKLVDYELQGELDQQHLLAQAFARENSRIEKKRNELAMGEEIPPWLMPVDFVTCVSRWRLAVSLLTSGVYFFTMQDTAAKRITELAQNDHLLKLGVPFEELIAKGE